MVTVSALLGHRNGERPLGYHMLGYLNVGGEPRTLVELLFVAITVLGFPVVVRDIFKERDVVYAPPAVSADDGTERQRHGYALMATMLDDAHATHEQWASHSAAFARLTIWRPLSAARSSNRPMAMCLRAAKLICADASWRPARPSV